MSLQSILATWPGRIVALILVATVGGGALVASRSAAPSAAPELKTATVARGNITQTVTVSGSISASGQARLAFKTGGKLAEVYVTVGQAVAPGTPLAKLDTTDLERAVATAQQTLDSAQASYEKALLSAADTRRSLTDTQKSTTQDIAAAQQSLAKLTSNYETSKRNFTALTDGAIADMTSYRSQIDGLRAQIQKVLTDIELFSSADVRTARGALDTADASMSNAQSYASSLLANALASYASTRDALVESVRRFDAAIGAGSDTNSATASFQTVQFAYQTALSQLTSTLDTVAAQVNGAQQSVTAAQNALSSNNSRFDETLGVARNDLIALQSMFVTQGQSASTSKTRLTQSGTPLNTMSDVLNGSLATAMQNVSSAQDRASTSVRSAQSAVDNIPFTLQSSQTSVQNAQSAVDTAKANLAAAVLTAPAAGTIASIANQVGEFVSGGSTNNAFIVLTNTNTLTLHATVGEGDIPSLRFGLVASVTVDALQGKKMTGKVVSLDPVATISQGVPVYGIDIAIDVPADGVRSGMSGTANVILASKQDVLIVPNGAIRTLNGQRGVQVRRGGETVDTAVTFGLSNDTVTEVVRGLDEGDVVVLPQARASASANPNQRGGAGGFGGGRVRIP